MIIPEDISANIQSRKIGYFSKSFHNIFSWKEFENVLNLRPFISSDNFTVIADRNLQLQHSLELERNASLSSNQGWITNKKSYTPTSLWDILNKYHCYIKDSSRVNKSVNSICSELENLLNGSADAHIYFTVLDNPNKAFGAHWDYSDNLIIQIEGTSKMEIWSETDTDLSRRFYDSINAKPIIDVIMNPGDAVFIPNKVYHRVTSLTKRLSISFPVQYTKPNLPQDRKWIDLDF